MTITKIARSTYRSFTSSQLLAALSLHILSGRLSEQFGSSKIKALGQARTNLLPCPLRKTE
jgi:hypothetical protein